MFFNSKTRSFIILATGLMLAKFWQETAYLMSYFMESQLGEHSSSILLTSKYQPLGVAIGYTFLGIIADRVGIRRLLTVTSMFMSVVALAFLYVQDIQMLYWYRLVIGMCICVMYLGAFPGIGLVYEDDKIPAKTSVMYTCAFASTMISPVLLTTVGTMFDWYYVIYFVIASTFLNGILAWKFIPEKTTSVSMTKYKSDVFALLKNKMFLLMALVSTICMGGFYGFVAIFTANLIDLNCTTEVSKFIITDMQFIGRIVLFVVTTWASYKLTALNTNKYLQRCLLAMALATGAMGLYLIGYNSLMPVGNAMSAIIAEASQSRHVISYMSSNFSAIWFFWIYAAFMAVAQPANKSKAMMIAGRSMAGMSQAIIGFSLSIGEFVFVYAAQSSWPVGSIAFLVFVTLSCFLVLRGVMKEEKAINA